MPLSEDFSRWREDPMTKMVMGALELAEKSQKQLWDDWSWGGNVARADDLAERLRELRVRADCYRALIDMTAGDVAAWLGIDDAE